MKRLGLSKAPIVIRRETLPNGVVDLSTDHCHYLIKRLKPGILLIEVSGKETGSLGRAPLGEVAVEAALHPPVRLFIDLSELSQVASTVSGDWTAWFRANEKSIRRVDALVSSTYLKLTVAASQLFSRTGDMIRIHTDAAKFASAIRQEIPTFDEHGDLSVDE